jgi:integrase
LQELASAKVCLKQSGSQLEKFAMLRYDYVFVVIALIPLGIAITLLQSSGASVKTTQELMRHSSPVMTLGTYAKAVTADKRIAQDAIAALFVGKVMDVATNPAS